MISNPFDFFIHYRWKLSHLSSLRSEEIELEGTYCAFCGKLVGNCTCKALISADYPDNGGGYYGDYDSGEEGAEGGSGGGGGGGDNTDDNDACISDDGNLANPLSNMELAPPNPANPAGATQGLTRGNGTINHTGVDFAATVGTPVYATHTGTIASTPYVDNQPNRIYDSIENDYVYPSDYTGDRNDAGNRIYINIGNNRQATYWHLQAETPIATNPRTGVPFTGGDAK